VKDAVGQISESLSAALHPGQEINTVFILLAYVSREKQVTHLSKKCQMFLALC